MRRPSPMLSPIGVRGSRLEYGSWKMICIRRRYGLRSAPLSAVRSTPSKRDRPGRRLDEAQQQPPDRGLAAARLADQAQGLAATDLEADAVDRLDLADGALEDAAADREVLDEVAHLDERDAGAGRARRDRGAGRRPTRRRRRGGAVAIVAGIVMPAASAGAASGRPPRRGTASSARRAPAATGSSAGWTSVAIATSSSTRVSAARREPAALRQVDEVGHVAGDDRQLVLDRADHRDRADQPARVRDGAGGGRARSCRSAPRSRPRT